MLRMRKVFVAALGRIEGHDEAMREAVVQAFIALVHAMLHGQEARNLADHPAHLREAAINGGLRSAGFEDERSVVVDHGGVESRMDD